jgi:hypothetical protein
MSTRLQVQRWAFALITLLALAVPAISQQSYVPNAIQQFFDGSGNPLANGTVYFYAPGTTTSKTVYQDTTGLIPYSNPIALNAAGEPTSGSGIYGTGSYRQQVFDSNGNLVWDAVTQTLPGTTPVLAVPSGGTGQVSFPSNSVLLGNGTAALGNSGVPLANQVLVEPSGGGAPTFGQVNLGASAAITGVLPLANGGTALSAVGASGTVLQSNGTALLYGPVPYFLLGTGRSSNYLIQNFDDKTIIPLGGGSQFTVTLGAPSTYSDANFAIQLTDNDGIGKTLSINGYSNFILWPGQTITIFNNGSNGWSFNPQQNLRYYFGGPLYVDTGGADTNDCLSVPTACATICGAVTRGHNNLDPGQAQFQILVTAGQTHTESCTVGGPNYNNSVFFIIGNGGAFIWSPPSNSNYCLLIGDGATIEIQNITFDATGNTHNPVAIQIHQTAIIDIFQIGTTGLSGVTFGTFPSGIHISSDHGGFINIDAGYTISGSTIDHIVLGPGTQAEIMGGITVIATGTPTISTYYTVSGSGADLVLAPSITYSGAYTTGMKQYSVSGNAALQLNSNTVPGNVSGTTADGGQAY